MLAWMQPELAFVQADDGTPFIKGSVVVISGAGYPNRIPAEIHFPGDYPRTEPWALQTPQRFPYKVDRHFYPSGRCCLWLPVASPWHRRDPDAFRHFLDQLTIFFHRQLVMDANPGSPFPGPQWDHGIAGYVAYLLEWRQPAPVLRRLLAGMGSTEVCACSSGKRFAHCHETTVNRFRRLAGADTTDAIVRVLGRGVQAT